MTSSLYMPRDKKKLLNWFDKIPSVLIFFVIVGMIVALSVIDGARFYVPLGGGGSLVLNPPSVLYFV